MMYFFEVLTQNKNVCQEMLRVILEDPELTVLDVITQSSERNIYGRSVRLDALCILGDKTRCNIEVQRSDNDNHLRRARFNASSITVRDSNTGEKFDDVINVKIVYISQFDIFRQGKTIYHIDKVIRETGSVVHDGLDEIFVNTVVDDGTDISRLMSCFIKTDINNPLFPELSNEVKKLKSTEGGVSAVCEVMERYQAKAVAENTVKVTVESYCRLKQTKSAILQTLMDDCGLSEQEAETKFLQYAPEGYTA